MKYLTSNPCSRTRNGHRILQIRGLENKIYCNKQREVTQNDVTKDVFVNIVDSIKTHRYRRRLKGHCQEHRFLYRALRRCFEENSKDRELICDILSELLACEGSLLCIFSILIPHHVTRNSFCFNAKMMALYPGCNNAMRLEDSVQAFEFYLQHLCDPVDMFPCNSAFDNIINEAFEIKHDIFYTPLIAATSSRIPEFVMLLLRYGADPLYAPETTCELPIQNPIANVITGLNSVIMFKNSFFNEETLSALEDEEDKGMQCVEYIARATQSIPLIEDMYFKQDEEEHDSSISRKYNLHPKLAAKLDVPGINGPRPLQHLCRIEIRNSLSKSCESGTLPSLTHRLPLPLPLIQYVDLKL